MKSLIFILLLCLTIATGCKTTQPVTIYRDVVKTEYRDRIQKDTIVVHDSVNTYVHGDTVYRDRIKTEYREKIRLEHDTVYATKTDSVVVTKYEYKDMTWWQKTTHSLGLALAFFVIFVIAFFLYRFFRR